MLAAGLSPRTCLGHFWVLKDLLAHFPKPLREATREDIAAWLGRREVSEAHLQRKQLVVRRFFKWLDGDEGGYPPCVAWIRLKRLRPNHRPVLTYADVERMARLAQRPRDKALVMVLYESAARLSEFLGLRRMDIVFDEFGARLRLQGKTGTRLVRIVDSVPDLMLWLSQHPDPREKAPLWITRNGPMAESTLGHFVRNLARKAGIAKPAGPHAFRHARLTELARELSDQELKEFAGWSRSSLMTDFYIHLSGQDVDRKILLNRGLLSGPRAGVPLRRKTCGSCGGLNSPTARYCPCGALLGDANGFEESRRPPPAVRNVPGGAAGPVG